jgi:hypothetical protein
VVWLGLGPACSLPGRTVPNRARAPYDGTGGDNQNPKQSYGSDYVDLLMSGIMTLVPIHLRASRWSYL